MDSQTICGRGQRIRASYWRLALALLICVCSLLVPVSAFAESKKYSIPSADFDVQVEKDGKVRVTENWTVSYESGSFTRFYKDIYKAVPAEEAFSLDPRSMHVTIDGKVCKEVFQSIEREDYTYLLEEGTDSYTYSCYLRSEDVTRKYQISYELNDAVKYVDHEYYLVVLRLIPANFSTHIDSVTATVTAPDGSTADIRNGQYFDKVDSKGNTVKASGKGWAGVFKVKVRMDGTDIAGAQPMSSDQLSNRVEREMKKPFSRFIGNNLPKVIIGLCFVPIIFLFLAGLAMKLREKKAYDRIEKELVNDPYLYMNIPERWVDRLDPSEFAFGCKKSGKSDKLLYAVLGSMFYKGAIHSDDGDMIEVVNESELSGTESEVLRFIASCSRMASGAISMNDFRMAITSQKGLLPKFERELKKSIEERVRTNLSGEEMKQYQNDWVMFTDYVDYYSEKGLKTDVLKSSTWLYFMMINDWKSETPFSVYPEPWINDYSPMLTDYYNDSRSAYRDYYGDSSSSSGSSCSSCSSCSGCGGGGAD